MKHSTARPYEQLLADDILHAVVAGLKHGKWEWDLVKVDAVASGVLRTLLLEGVIAPFGAVPAQLVFGLHDKTAQWCRDYLRRGGTAYLARTGASTTALAELQSRKVCTLPLYDWIRLVAKEADLARGDTPSTP